MIQGFLYAEQIYLMKLNERDYFIFSISPKVAGIIWVVVPDVKGKDPEGFLSEKIVDWQ